MAEYARSILERVTAVGERTTADTLELETETSPELTISDSVFSLSPPILSVSARLTICTCSLITKFQPQNTLLLGWSAVSLPSMLPRKLNTRGWFGEVHVRALRNGFHRR